MLLMPGGVSTSPTFGFAMILGAKRAVFAVLTVAALLSKDIRAEDYVSDRYGFRFPIPNGYEDLKDDDPNSLKALIETDKGLNAYPISIRIKHSGGEFNPSTKIDISKFPSDKDQRS